MESGVKMIIETERLILREYTYDDFNELYKILSDPITMKHYPKPYDEKGTKRWIGWSLENYQKYGFGLWAIILKETNQFIGDCGITIQNINNKLLPEVGYHINKNFWRCGYAKEAGKAVIDWGFKNTNYDALYSYMNAENVASYSTAASIGMIKVDEYYDEDEHLYVYKINKNI
jgi:RimJ/RimL family protein N-acetyltransferase